MKVYNTISDPMQPPQRFNTVPYIVIFLSLQRTGHCIYTLNSMVVINTLQNPGGTTQEDEQGHQAPPTEGEKNRSEIVVADMSGGVKKEDLLAI